MSWLALYLCVSLAATGAFILIKAEEGTRAEMAGAVLLGGGFAALIFNAALAL